MMKSITYSEKQTFNLGKKFAEKLQGGEVIGLTGDLGAGKTVFIKGLAKGLKIEQIINSPTFVLMKLYKINSKFKNQNAKLQCKIQNLVHVDAYRLNSSQELINVGIEDYLEKKNAIVVIEWGEKVKDILPKDKISVKIKFGGKKNERVIRIK